MSRAGLTSRKNLNILKQAVITQTSGTKRSWMIVNYDWITLVSAASRNGTASLCEERSDEAIHGIETAMDCRGARRRRLATTGKRYHWHRAITSLRLCERSEAIHGIETATDNRGAFGGSQ